MKSVLDESAEHVPSPCSSSSVDSFDDPQVLPRIGNEYQAEIPSLVSELERLEKVNYKVLGDAKDVEEFSDFQIESWSKTEKDSFLLGLCIFGKNFRPVKRFIGSKEMGDILCYYYGKFYTSDGYHRWSESRKSKGRRGVIQGQKLFAGWRLKELLSRLFPHVSKECQDRLIESSRYFVEGKISLEEYMFKLKDKVGLHVLIEAVGVGKGKQDFTGISLEPTQDSYAIPFHPEVPVGKACSSLTSAEIIKFLTANCRLSKGQMNDLFWEAVWPRLLARGWHSEQPRYSAVFLVPGIKNFSRGLEKGNHYFDSVSEVLKNVASDPSILELDSEEAKGNEDGVDRLVLPEIQGADDLPNKQQRHYLLPRRVNGSRDPRKFTVVDTSMLLAAEQPKLRDLRSLPAQAESLSNPNLFSETKQDTLEESEHDAEETDASNAAEDMIDGEAFVDSTNCVTSNLNTGMRNTPDHALVAMETHEHHTARLPNDKYHEGESTILLNDEKCPSRTMKDEFSQKLEPEHLKYLAPLMKQEDMTDCNHRESSCSNENMAVDGKPTQGESHVQSNLPSVCQGMEYQVDQQHLSTASSVEKDSLSKCNEGSDAAKSRSWICIDLNLPPISEYMGADEPLIEDMMQNHDSSNANESPFLSETSKQPEPLNLPEVGASVEQQQPIIKSQRPTRNRPLSTKAWEALEHDFFRTKRKRKGETSQNKSTSRSQRARGGTTVSAAFDDSVATNVAD